MSLPLVALTRADAHPFTRALAHELRGEADVAGAAVTRQTLLPDQPGEARALAASGRYRWIVVTSPTAARLLTPTPLDLAPGTRVAAVGEGTAAALEEAGVPVALTGPGSAAGLAEVFPAPDGPAAVLLPCSQQARPTLAAGLAGAGWVVDRVDLYATTPLPDLPVLYTAADVIAATAGSAVDSLDSHGVWRDHPGLPLVTIGRPSLAVAAARGIAATAAATPDVTGLAAAIRALLATRKD